MKPAASRSRFARVITSLLFHPLSDKYENEESKRPLLWPLYCLAISVRRLQAAWDSFRYLGASKTLQGMAINPPPSLFCLVFLSLLRPLANFHHLAQCDGICQFRFDLLHSFHFKRARLIAVFQRLESKFVPLKKSISIPTCIGVMRGFIFVFSERLAVRILSVYHGDGSTSAVLAAQFV